MPPANRHHNALPHGYRLGVYRIDHVIGQGGFGITYLGEDNLDRKVAIKEYFPTELAARVKQEGEVKPISDDRVDMYQWGLGRFLDEAKTLARFKHPNIVSILNFFEENGTAYSVMPYEEGDPLDKLIRQGKLADEESLLGILMPILDGLEKVHATGLIHRDIKPANIYIRHDGSPVLIDFGSARTAVGQQTKTLTALVSPGYAPFEQYHGSGDKQGPWTDIYALGATLYAVINRGRGPAEATMRANLLLENKSDPLVPVAEIAQGRYSPLFLAAIDAALVFRPDHRPQNIAAWRKLFHSPQKATPKRGPTKKNQADIHTQVRTGNKSRKHTTPAKDSSQFDPSAQTTSKKGLIVAVLLLAIGAGGYLVWQQGYLEPLIAKLISPPEETPPIVAAAPQRPKTGNAILYVSSTPEGATVILNGETKGTTPYEANDLPPGDHQLELTHPESELFKERITLVDYQIIKKSYQLHPASGHASIYSEPTGATISIDGKDTRKITPATIQNIKVGKRQLTLYKDRYYPKEITITIKRNDTISGTYTLEGGHLVEYQGQWMEPKEKTQLIIEAKRQADAETKLIAEKKRKAEAEARRHAEKKRKAEEQRRLAQLERQRQQEEVKKRVEAQRKEKYNIFIVEAGRAVRNKEYVLATSQYNNALALYPNDQMALNGIVEVKILIDKETCQQLVGTWYLKPNGITWEVHEDHTVYGTWLIFSSDGIWKCLSAKEREFVISWPGCGVCLTEYLILSDDGNALESSRNSGTTGERVIDSN